MGLVQVFLVLFCHNEILQGQIGPGLVGTSYFLQQIYARNPVLFTAWSFQVYESVNDLLLFLLAHLVKTRVQPLQFCHNRKEKAFVKKNPTSVFAKRNINRRKSIVTGLFQKRSDMKAIAKAPKILRTVNTARICHISHT